MPTIEEIKFEGDLVSYSHGCTVVGIDTWTTDTGIEIPGIQRTVQSEDCSHIVVENNVDVQSAVHTTLDCHRGEYSLPVWKRSLSRLATAASKAF